MRGSRERRSKAKMQEPKNVEIARERQATKPSLFLMLVVPLRGLNVETGANGSGKSSSYRTLRLLADAPQGRVIPSLALRTDRFLLFPYSYPPLRIPAFDIA